MIDSDYDNGGDHQRSLTTALATERRHFRNKMRASGLFYNIFHLIIGNSTEVNIPRLSSNFCRQIKLRRLSTIFFMYTRLVLLVFHLSLLNKKIIPRPNPYRWHLFVPLKIYKYRQQQKSLMLTPCWVK